ncbi:MAG: CRISPR-associated helicase Cas3' [Pseudomonadota bacterium]
MVSLQSVLSFWGKTWRHEQKPGAPPVKPALHHLLDVAAAAEAIQQAAPARLARDAAALELEPARLVSLSAVLAGAHDLGKFSRAFQIKSPEHWPAALGTDVCASDAPHWRLTQTILAHQDTRLMELLFPQLERSERLAIAASVAGHHGQPPDPSDIRRSDEATLGRAALDAAVLAAEALWNTLGAPVVQGDLAEHWATRFAWRQAGLTTLADWVGSDVTFFEFWDPTLEPEAYWPLAQAAAQQAVNAKGLTFCRPAAFEGARMLFPTITDPRPLQKTAETIALPDGPLLALLEDATGAGKTEAALILAHRLISEGRAEGVYFALPTMATANAMFKRLSSDAVDAAAPYRRFFHAEAQPSLALAHGAAALSEGFREVRLRGLAAANGEDQEDAAALCAEWLADDRRKAFLADMGAGTIDQALISVLPKRHLALRQYGLAGKVLIVDEAHAYDAYMTRELERLLEFHAAAGGSAIVMSATLTNAQTALLEAAYFLGLTSASAEGPAARKSRATSEAKVADPAAAPYPSLALRSEVKRVLKAIDPAPSTIRSVKVERIGSAEQALAAAHAAAEAGAAVAVIRNAVDDAVTAYRALRDGGARVTLFHARFAMVDRLAIEADAVRDFGKRGTRRAGRILVATQVIEQSLDLDFDVMITDLAPVDALIQRAGRLWRHERGPRPVAGPTLQVIAPDWRAVTQDDWLCETQPSGRFVYNAALQWRSAESLFEAGEIDAPAGLRPLVERADGGDAPLPEALQNAQRQAEGAALGDAAYASANLISWANGYAGVEGVGEDQELGTRLGCETVTLRLARESAEGLVPWAPRSTVGDDPRDARAWALSEVTLPKRKGEIFESARPAPETWTKFDAEKRLALVQINGSVELRLSTSASEDLCYSPDLGLFRAPRDPRG